MEETKLPESIENFSKDLIQLCQKHKVSNFSGEMKLNTFFKDDAIDCKDWGRFNFHYEWGRHGDDSRRISVRGNREVNEVIKL